MVLLTKTDLQHALEKQSVRIIRSLIAMLVLNGLGTAALTVALLQLLR